MGHVVTSNLGHTTPGPQGAEEDIIPTAIVIKNIPFNVKRETLLDIIVGVFIFVLSTPPRSHHLSSRLLFRSRRLMRSTTISTRQANSAVSPSLISGSQLMRMLWLLLSMVLTCKVVSCA